MMFLRGETVSREAVNFVFHVRIVAGEPNLTEILEVR